MLKYVTQQFSECKKKMIKLASNSVSQPAEIVKYMYMVVSTWANPACIQIVIKKERFINFWPTMYLELFVIK